MVKDKDKVRKNKQKERKEKEKIVCFIHLNHSVLLKKRQWQDLNLRLQWRSDFESHALDHSATLSYKHYINERENKEHRQRRY